MKREVLPARVNILLFPEFFFNRLYTERILTTTQVEEILKAQREHFSGCSNVLCSLCFFHHFEETEAPDWLKAWDPPDFIPKEFLKRKKTAAGDKRHLKAKANNFLTTRKKKALRKLLEVVCTAKKQIAEGYVERKQCHLANYQMFIWDGEILGVYRKSSFCDEFQNSLGTDMVTPNTYLYEFGNWKTKLLCAEQTQGRSMGEVLFGPEGLIVPRICYDVAVAAREEKNYDADLILRRQLDHAKIFLISASDLSNGTLDYAAKIACRATLVVVDSSRSRDFLRVGRSRPKWTPPGVYVRSNSTIGLKLEGVRADDQQKHDSVQTDSREESTKGPSPPEQNRQHRTKGRGKHKWRSKKLSNKLTTRIRHLLYRLYLSADASGNRVLDSEQDRPL